GLPRGAAGCGATPLRYARRFHAFTKPIAWATLAPPSMEDLAEVIRYDHEVLFAVPTHRERVTPIGLLLVLQRRGIPERRALAVRRSGSCRLTRSSRGCASRTFGFETW